MPTSVHDLRTLVLSRYPAILVDSTEEERATALLTAVAVQVNLPLYEWTVIKGLGVAGNPSGLPGSNAPLAGLANIADVRQAALFVLYDFARYLADPAVSRKFRDVLEQFASPSTMSTIVMVGHGGELPPEIRPHVVTYELVPPTREDYRGVVHAVGESLTANGRAKVSLTPEDHDAFAGALAGLTINQARQLLARVAIDDGVLDASDLARVAELKAAALRDDGLLEYFPPQDNPTELGGFAKLREWLERAALARSQEAAALNLPAPGGLLLVGVQGCGKSLAAKFIARTWRQPLLKLDAARLYDKYIGETEKNLRRAIATAESLAPVVLWLDEIEKALAPGGGSEDGGVSQRLLGSFLTWLQEKRADVFVVATANDISQLPPELLRKGRFDEIFFVDLPSESEREQIFRIHLGLRKVDPSTFDLGALAAASDGFSGAEIEQAVIAGALRSLQASRPFDSPAVVEELRATVPLSVARAEDIKSLREWASGRFVPVS
jgi:MoxR-like ATPase